MTIEETAAALSKEQVNSFKINERAEIIGGEWKDDLPWTTAGSGGIKSLLMNLHDLLVKKAELIDERHIDRKKHAIANNDYLMALQNGMSLGLYDAAYYIRAILSDDIKLGDS